MAGVDLRDGSGLANFGKPDLRMKERKEPTFVQFGDGEVCEGVLVSIQQVEVGDPDNPNAPKRPAVKYTLEDPNTREMYAFLGTYTVNTKLRPSDKGHFVSVRYEGEDPTVTRNGRPMKKFRVLVSDKPFAGVAQSASRATSDLGITDDDISF